MFASWTHDAQGISETRFVSLSSDGTVSDQPSPPEFVFETSSMVSSDGVIYTPVTDEGDWMALDTDTWAERWSATKRGVPAQSNSDGSLWWITWDENLGMVLQELSPSGTVESVYPTSIYDSLLVLRDQGILHGVDVTGSVQAIAMPVSAASVWSFQGGSFSSCLIDFPFFSLLAPEGPSMTYGFDSSWATVTDLRDKVVEALDLWSKANQREQLNLRFLMAPSNENPDLLFKGGQITAPRLAQMRPLHHVVGRLRLAEITISDDPQRAAQTPEMYLKLALHEIGHVMGLGDWYGPGFLGAGATVMIQASGVDDPRNNLPLTVTACDAKMAKRGYNRDWP